MEHRMSHISHDDFSRSPVDNCSLRPWWYLLIIEMGVMISIPIFFVGGQLGHSLTLQDLILSTLAGGAILGIIGSLTARLGAVTRCSTALIARLTFGKKGAGLISLLLALGMTGWWGVNTELFAKAVADLAREIFHCQLSEPTTILLSGLAMITTAALGIKAIGRLSYLAVPLLIAGLANAVAHFSSQANFSQLLSHTPEPGTALTLGAAAATVASGFIVGASMNPDFSRFAKTPKHGIAYALTDYSIVYPLLLIVCGSLAILGGKSNIMLYLVPPGLTWLLFVMMMFATWAANDCNLYSTSLSLAALLPSLSRAKLAVAAGVIGIALAELHVTSHMVSFLCLLGILIAPVSGVFVINSLSRRSAVSQEELQNVQAWKIAPLAAWLTGTTIGFLTTPKDSLGLGLLQLSTMPTLDAILAAGLTMLVLQRLETNSAKIELGNALRPEQTAAEVAMELVQ